VSVSWPFRPQHLNTLFLFHLGARGQDLVSSTAFGLFPLAHLVPCLRFFPGCTPLVTPMTNPSFFRRTNPPLFTAGSPPDINVPWALGFFFFFGQFRGRRPLPPQAPKKRELFIFLYFFFLPPPFLRFRPWTMTMGTPELFLGVHLHGASVYKSRSFFPAEHSVVSSFSPTPKISTSRDPFHVSLHSFFFSLFKSPRWRLTLMGRRILSFPGVWNSTSRFLFFSLLIPPFPLNKPRLGLLSCPPPIENPFFSSPCVIFFFCFF